MSVAPLSNNAEREAAIDFTKPFKTRGVMGIMKKSLPETSYFQFLSPLSVGVWLCVLLAISVFGACLYLFESNSGKLRKEDVKFDYYESFWFIFGSIVGGSTESTPLTLPGRILTSAWWFFALILISSYTANLAAFLTVRKIKAPIDDIGDLTSQSKIHYGTVRDSGVMNMLKSTKIETLAKMWVHMSDLAPDNMVMSTEQGLTKVRRGNYAFLWDSTVIKYETAKDCDLVAIGPEVDPKGFGIGVPPGANYRETLTMAILYLSDTGKLQELDHKWWGKTSCVVDEAAPEETPELDLENVAGVYFVLLGGVFAAFLLFALNRLRDRLLPKTTEKSENRPLRKNNGRTA